MDGPRWEKTVNSSVNLRSKTGYSVLGIRAAGFVGIHVSAALKRCVDYVLWLDNCKSYYDPTHKRASTFVGKNEIFIVEGDINDTVLLTKLFEVIHFTHEMHLAAQAGVRYAMQYPKSYIHSNIAGFVNVLEVCKNANPQPAIVWASSRNTSPVPVSDLVSILEKLLKVKAKRRVMKLPRNGDVPFTHANISLAQREFGYKPTTDLQTGLKKFVRWYEKYYGSGKKSDR
ncbi:putative UDP-glucuronate 4-epimerase [Helianthus annuus]|nr:putative UDP-glucuronate 4-epimerase [Helianthus annuus]